MQKAIFSIPLNPKLSPDAFSRFYSIVEKYKDYIYDIYFTSRMPPFIQDAMGDVFDKNQADDIIENAFILQNNLGIPLSATFNNIEVPPTQELLDLWIENFSPLYERGIKTVTLPHTLWMASGRIQKVFPDLYVKNTILRNVCRANEVVELVKAGFDYINLDRDLMRDRDALLRIKEAKEYCIEKYEKDVKISLLANEGCWGNCSVMDEHYTYNNTRMDVNQPTYFFTSLSKYSCPAWDRDEAAHELKRANFPPWREDWVEFIEDLGIDVIKMHGRESPQVLFQTLDIVKRFAEEEEILWDVYNQYIKDMHLENAPINGWRKKIKNCKFDCWECHYCEDVVGHKAKHRYVTQINNALHKADLEESKLTDLTLQIPGLTSNKVKHFINNLVAMSDTRYLEIGVYQGAIFTSALEGNKINAIAIEDFSAPQIAPMRDILDWKTEEGNPLEILKKNISLVSDPVDPETLKNIVVSGWVPWMSPIVEIINKNAFDVTEEDIPFKISVFFYDGDHSYEAQKKIIKHYLPMMDETFIMIIDDWNWKQVQEGTIESIKEENLKVMYDHFILTSGENPNDYWNGLGIFVLKQPKK